MSTPIFSMQTAGRPMRVAAFMSGSGTNIEKLLELERQLARDNGVSPFQVMFIFSDRSDGSCAGEKIALNHNIPYFSYDIRMFHKLRLYKRTVLTSEGMDDRKRYDGCAKTLVTAFNIDIVALGGYMSYTTIKNCVNVHPADLTILNDKGKRKYVGDNAVRDAILAGEKELRASTLWTDEGVDTGPILMVSGACKVNLPKPIEDLAKDKEKLDKVVIEHQDRLKKIGDWEIFPRTIELIARGYYGFDSEGKIQPTTLHI